MAWIRSHKKSGGIYPDGNDITYPVVNPTTDNKLYSEKDVNDIAVALGESVKLADMASAVQELSGASILFIPKGRNDYINMNIQILECEISS